MALESGRREVNRIKAEIAVLSQKQSELYDQLHSLEPAVQKECKHPKVVYTDGHVSHDPDEDDTHEYRICLSCGLSERGERKYNQPYDFGRTKWFYKILTNEPIRRFCVTGRSGLSGTIEYEKQANSTFGEATFEKRMGHYWHYVEKRLFKMTYAARVKAVMRLGYPV